MSNETDEPTDAVSELRIAIARVLGAWQLERAELENEPHRAELDALDARLRALEAGGAENWEALAMLQTNLIASMRRGFRRVARLEVLSEHIEAIKAAVTPPSGGVRDPFFAEVCRAARLVANPPGGDRIGVTIAWLGGDIMFPGGGGGGGSVRVRELTEEEQQAMKDYLTFVQQEPLPESDAAARQRLFEARLKWPKVAALFEEGEQRTCSICLYPYERCRCVENGQR